MTRRKIETPHAKTCSAYEKQLKRKRKANKRLWTSNLYQKILIQKYERLTKDLMKKGFVSKEYVAKFITRKNDVRWCMRCSICNEIDSTHSAYCIVHGRVPHKHSENFALGEKDE